MSILKAVSFFLGFIMEIVYIYIECFSVQTIFKCFAKKVCLLFVYLTHSKQFLDQIIKSFYCGKVYNILKIEFFYNLEDARSRTVNIRLTFVKTQILCTYIYHTLWKVFSSLCLNSVISLNIWIVYSSYWTYQLVQPGKRKQNQKSWICAS